jgi:hypothetical protein
MPFPARPLAAKGRVHLTENVALEPGIDAAAAAVSETLLKSAREAKSMAITELKAT